MTATEMYLVGGAVRDEIMGLPTNDYDFTVVGPQSFEEMLAHLKSLGFYFNEGMLKPEHHTAKCVVPQDHPLRRFTNAADFVLARRDGPYSDGRHPDYTKPGDLRDDLSRRDFTVNAVAKVMDGPEKGALIDPFMGVSDIRTQTLRFVGDPMTRITEDGLRVFRGFRFMVMNGLVPTPETLEALLSPEAAEMLHKVPVSNRIYDEMMKMFRFDTFKSMEMLVGLPTHTREAIFRDGLHLRPSLKS